MTNILLIPDAQIQKGVNLDHIKALSNFIVKHQPEYIVNLGDWYDMHSLNIYDKGKKALEGARYQDDIDAGLIALDILEDEIVSYNLIQAYNKKKQYRPTKYFLIGNHEYRIVRHAEANPILENKLSLDDLQLKERGWVVYPFLEVLNINEVYFSHYFVNPDSAKNYPFSSSVEHQLVKLGFSFVQGHRQGLYVATPRYLQSGKIIRGIVCGSFYSHKPGYLGPQGNSYWRGALYLEGVEEGNYRLIELPLDYLIKNYS